MKRKLYIEIDENNDCYGCRFYDYRFYDYIGKEQMCKLFNKFMPASEEWTRLEECIESEVVPVVQVIAPDNVEIHVEGGKK